MEPCGKQECPPSTGNKEASISSATKLSLFVDNMIIYVRKPTESTKTALELICWFRKVTGYKINI